MSKMKTNIIKAEDLPKDANVYLKKDGSNYRVVHPIRNDDGSINWFNLTTGGSWKNLIILGVVVAIVLGFLFEYSNNVKILQDQAGLCRVITNPFG